MQEWTVSKKLHEAAKAYGNRSAFVFPSEDVRISFQELEKNTSRVAKALLKHGYAGKAHIGIWSTNTERWIYTALACAQIGAVFVPLNVAFKREELEDICRRTDIDALFVMDSFAGVPSKQLLSGFYSGSMIDAAKFPRLKDIWCFSDTADWAGRGWGEFIRAADSVSDETLRAAEEQVTGDDVYDIQYTSGTTSKPKGAQVIQKGVLESTELYVKLFHLDADDVTYAPLPLFHCFANVLTTLAPLLSGGSTVYPPAFSVRQTLSLLETEKCTCMMGVPSMYSMLMASPDFDSNRIYLKKAGSGGAYCPPALAEQIEAQFGMNHLIVGYGLSEGGSVCTITDIYDSHESRLFSIGRPLPNFEMSLMDPATGRIDRALESGELIMRGDSVMIGYYNDPENTAKALDADGWLHTGDLAHFDADGCVHLIGRMKDIIIRGGENISPTEIENLLDEVEGIRDVQCVGVPDEIVGEEIAAFLIESGEHAPDDDTLRAYVAERLAKFKVPKYIFRVDEMPLNSAGKVLKTKLREMAKERVCGARVAIELQ